MKRCRKSGQPLFVTHAVTWLLTVCMCTPPGLADDSDVVRGSAVPWVRHIIDNTSKGADGVKLGDINHDGQTDLVTGWEEGGVVRVYLNPGVAKVGSAWPHVTVGTAGDVEDAFFVDVDNDNLMEVVSCCEGKTRTLYIHRCVAKQPVNNHQLLNPLNWQTQEIADTIKSNYWMQAAALDLDGDRQMDLVTGSKNNGASIGWIPSQYLKWDRFGCNFGNDDPAARQENVKGFRRLRDAGWIMSLSTIDMNGDGHPDIFATDRKGQNAGAFWLQNPGSNGVRARETWKYQCIGAGGRECMFADPEDINYDGLVDVAIAVKPMDLMIYLQQQDGSWSGSSLSLLQDDFGDAKAVKVADINNDGLCDFFYTCENANGKREGVFWLEQQRHGPWKQHSIGGWEGVKFDLMQSLDLDADGDLDVITCEERDQLGVVWYENPLR